MKAFHSEKELFILSNNKYLFKEKLIQNNLNITNKLFFSLTNIKIKEKSKIIYDNLKVQHFNFVNIFSKYYPEELRGILSAPLLLCYKGDIGLLNKKVKRLVMYNSNKELMKCIEYKSIYDSIKKNKGIICINNDMKSPKIKVKSVDILSEEYEYKENINKEDLHILVPKQFNSLPEVIASISDSLLIFSANYNKEIYRLSYDMIDFSKEILVVPGNICNKDYYFSNYLIREGATVILSYKDIEKIFE